MKSTIRNYHDTTQVGHIPTFRSTCIPVTLSPCVPEFLYSSNTAIRTLACTCRAVVLHEGRFAVNNSSGLDNFGSTLDKNGYSMDNFGYVLAHLGAVSVAFRQTKTPQIPIFNTKNKENRPHKKISINLRNLWTKKMQNEPNFNPTKICISLYVASPKASSLKPRDSKNEPKQTQLIQTPQLSMPNSIVFKLVFIRVHSWFPKNFRAILRILKPSFCFWPEMPKICEFCGQTLFFMRKIVTIASFKVYRPNRASKLFILKG